MSFGRHGTEIFDNFVYKVCQEIKNALKDEKQVKEYLKEGRVIFIVDKGIRVDWNEKGKGGIIYKEER